MTPWPVIALAAAAGACVGSFVATAAGRAAQDRGWIGGRSRCDHCDAALGLAETVPLISYAALGGHCRRCQGRIAVGHLLGELCGAMIGALAALSASLVHAGLLAALGFLLLSLSFIDIKTLRLPDLLTLMVAVTGVGLAAEQGSDQLLAGLAAAAVTLAVLLGLRRLHAARAGKQGLGLGDVKLAAALAIWLGALLPVATALAAAAALVWMLLAKPASGKAPFGPFLAASAWVVGLVWTQPWML